MISKHRTSRAVGVAGMSGAFRKTLVPPGLVKPARAAECSGTGGQSLLDVYVRRLRSDADDIACPRIKALVRVTVRELSGLVRALDSFAGDTHRNTRIRRKNGFSRSL